MAETQWQLNWINQFDAERKEHQTALAKEHDINQSQKISIQNLRNEIDLKNGQLAKLNDKCKQQDKKISELEYKCKISQEICVRQKERINTLKCRCKMIHRTVVRTEDAGNQTYKTSTAEKATSTQFNVPCQAMPVNSMNMSLTECTERIHPESTNQTSLDSPQFNQTPQTTSFEYDPLKEHRYFTTTQNQSSHVYLQKISPVKERYRCQNCPYWTCKKSSFIDHQN